MKKKIPNFIFSMKRFFFASLLIILISFAFFISVMREWDKARIFMIALIAPEMKEEYKIWGILYMKLNEPSSIYILCITLSLKNNAFVTKFTVKFKKNKNIFKILGL